MLDDEIWMYYEICTGIQVTGTKQRNQRKLNGYTVTTQTEE